MINEVSSYLLNLFLPVWRVITDHPYAFAVIMIVMVALVTVCAILDEGGRQIDDAKHSVFGEDEK